MIWSPGPSPPIWRAGTWHNARLRDDASCLKGDYCFSLPYGESF
jgi:hypothetical protein